MPEVVQSVVLTRTQARSTAMPSGEALAASRRPARPSCCTSRSPAPATLAAELAESYGADCPVAVVANASQPNEVVLRGTLGDIADQVEAAGLRQAAVILVGKALAEDVRGGESYLYDPARDRSAKRR